MQLCDLVLLEDALVQRYSVLIHCLDCKRT